MTLLRRLYLERLKRIFDVILAIGSLLMLSPILLTIMVCIKMDSKGPVFFRQRRVGIKKTYFYIYKFRTMKDGTPRDCPTHLFKDPDMHITRVGHALRKHSLDEMPQILNILKGEMSFVGPRTVF